MDVKIDYLSATLMHDPRHGEGEAAQWQSVTAALWEGFPVLTTWLSRQGGWQPGGARGHYAFSQFHPRLYSAIRYGGSANHVLLEMPGTCCQALRDDEALEGVLSELAPRLTRCDVAVDIPNGGSPRDFVLAGYNARFKSYAEIVSEAGETEYVGSMKSERFARVYRYNEPHPRAGVMRVEFVLRSQYAKTLAAEILEHGLLSAADRLGNTWGWQSPTWQPLKLTDGKLRASRADRHEPGRVKWIHEVVVPCLVKAHAEGLIDLAAIIERLQSLSDAASPLR